MDHKTQISIDRLSLIGVFICFFAYATREYVPVFSLKEMSILLPEEEAPAKGFHLIIHVEGRDFFNYASV
jgi:hypothetical protein